MSTRIKIFLIITTTFGLLYLAVISLYFSPGFQGTSIENDFREYYQAYAKGNRVDQSRLKKIQRLVNSAPLRLSQSSDAPLENSIWIGMFSGNDNISLTSGAVHFDYLIKNNALISPFSLVLSSILLAAVLLVSFSLTCHNILTYIFRLNVAPTETFIINTFYYFKDLGIKGEKKLQSTGYVKMLLAFLPGWLIGLIIGYSCGDYSSYFEYPVVDVYLFIFLHFYCVCAGCVFVLLINQIILYFSMRLDIDIVTNKFHDLACGVVAFAISVWIYNNSLGSTASVTLATLFYTIVLNNRSRGRALREYRSSSLAGYGFFKLGLTYHRRRKITKAINMFKKAIDIYNNLGLAYDTAPVYGSLGKVYFDNGDLDLAENTLRKALALYTGLPNSHKAIDTINRLCHLIKERREPAFSSKKYSNNAFKFSFIIPADWLEQNQAPQFTKTGGQIVVSHKTHRATFNVSVGPPDRPEWIRLEVRSMAMKEFLKRVPGLVGNIEVTTSSDFPGQANVVSARYDTITILQGVRRQRKNGIISIIQNNLEYTMQWSCEYELEKEIKMIINSFNFDS